MCENEIYSACDSIAWPMFSLGSLTFSLLFAALWIVALWFVFERAGRHGWAVFIPIYNAITFFRACGKSGWWVLLMLIPVANLVLYIIALAELSRRFGRGGGFTVGLFFLPIIFFPILAFSDNTYTNPNQA